MRWTQDGCSEGEDGPSYECAYTKLETELLSFLPVLLYFKSSHLNPGNVKSILLLVVVVALVLVPFMRVFSFHKFTWYVGLYSCSDAQC